MDFTLSQDLFMAILNFVWIVVTYGYVPHIIFIFCVSVAVIYLIITFSFFREIKYVMIDKYYFLKGYLYFWSLEKYHFIKSYFRAVWYLAREWDKSVWIGLGLAVVFTLLILYLAFDYAISSTQAKLNATIPKP